MKLSKQQVALFQETVWQHYRQHSRDLPWRRTTDPYAIMVSEIMLQQTQVERVLPKYLAFLERFPYISSLAVAGLGDVLALWVGLGYNRRAKYLHAAAQIIVMDYAGQVPQDIQDLSLFPGIGKNTAAAIVAYAYNKPVVFVETNIRSVYMHHFFASQNDVHDKDISELVEQTLDTENPREWYWALMDYGTYLKKTHGNNIRQSRHYVRQSTFDGSRRQIRGKIIRLLTEKPHSLLELETTIADKRFMSVLADLLKEELIEQSGDRLSLKR